MANGTTSGMAPLAHIAMYKVCSSIGYPETVILAVIDAAIEDGVDVLSISFGTKSNQFWTSDVIAEDPWLLTVGARTTDRKLRAIECLGDGKEIDGVSEFQPKDFSKTLLPLIRNVNDAFCSAEALENMNVKGKFVLCIFDGNVTRIDKGHHVKDASSAGMILMNDELQGFNISA
ncbi:hypothetical protein KY289_008419 [Solanum tuberosum]|nr:hypothetical protein KY289_008419 [Solanum tuberosum]